MSEKYNGWTNYETWCLALWLNNDEATYRHWQQAAEEEVEGVVDTPHVQEGIWTHVEGARITLAERIRQSCLEHDKLTGADFGSDLLRAALERINWQEIAADMLDGFFPRTTERQPVVTIQRRPEFRFPLGRIVSTPGALKVLSRDSIVLAVNRHARGDWGLVDTEDARTNDQAVDDGLRVLSAYDNGDGQKFWIITEADRSVTTILLPGEY